MHQIRLGGQAVGGQCRRWRPPGPTFHGWFHGSAPLPACVSQTGMPQPLGEFGQRCRRFGVDDPSAGDDEWPLGRRGSSPGRRELALGRRDVRGMRYTLFSKKARGIVVRLRLDVLRQRRGDRAGLGRIGQDPHRLGQAREDLLRPVDAVPDTRETGRKASLTLTSMLSGCSSCCRPDAGSRLAKISPGKRRTGRRLIVARAAPVTMLVAPGPTTRCRRRSASGFSSSRRRRRCAPSACSFRGW